MQKKKKDKSTHAKFSLAHCPFQQPSPSPSCYFSPISFLSLNAFCPHFLPNKTPEKKVAPHPLSFVLSCRLVSSCRERNRAGEALSRSIAGRSRPTKRAGGAGRCSGLFHADRTLLGNARELWGVGKKTTRGQTHALSRARAHTKASGGTFCGDAWRHRFPIRHAFGGSAINESSGIPSTQNAK